MILRKKNIVIISVVASVAVLLILAILGVLYLKTDMFKSKETLFAKYFVQNFDIIEILKYEDVLGIEKTLSENKYTSEFGAKIEYTENVGTSAENKDNPINDIIVGIKSDVDKMSDYAYRDITIKDSDENLVKFEYLNQEQNHGIRLDGIKQFLSADATTDQEILELVRLENIETLTSEIDINPILDFSEEEKQELVNTYLGIIQTRISKDKYYKQSKTLITVDNEDVQTNAYYIKLTLEEYNNLLIDILIQISQEEIILSRLNLIEDEIRERIIDYDPNESLRNQFINMINDKIEEIENNNIGSDEVRITVYEKNQKTVRTSIEKITDKTIIDLSDDLSVSIEKTEIGDIEKQTFINLQKDESNNMFLEYGIIQNNETIHSFECNYLQTMQGNEIDKEIDVRISNQKNECILNIANNIQIVDEFSNQITFDTNNLYLNTLEEEQLETVLGIVLQNVEKQLTNLESKISTDDCIEMLQNLGYIEGDSSIELPVEGEVSEIEKKRFNSQFEFFVSENLTTDNIKELMDVSENNFEDMKVLLKSGDIEDLDVEKISSTEESKEYVENISELLIFIKSNTSNSEKKEDAMKFFENDTDNKYNVFIQYDDSGLVRLIRVQIQEE